MSFGQIKLENFVGLKNMPQKAQSAWDAVFTPERVGTQFKPLVYVGTQEVHGMLHWFIAERTQPYRFEIRNIVKMAILERTDAEEIKKDGKYAFAEETISKIF